MCECVRARTCVYVCAECHLWCVARGKVSSVEGLLPTPESVMLSCRLHILSRSNLVEIPCTDQFKRWADECAACFGGLDICAVDAL